MELANSSFSLGSGAIFFNVGPISFKLLHRQYTGWVNSHINRNYASWHISRCKISRCILPSVASARPQECARKTKQIEQIHKSKEIYNIINSLMTYLVNILKMFSRAWLRKPMFSCIWKAWEIDRDCISSYFHNTTKCTIE